MTRCPNDLEAIRRALALLSRRKWTLPILIELAEGWLAYSDLRDAVNERERRYGDPAGPELSWQVLSDALLKELVPRGVVERMEPEQNPTGRPGKTVLYRLTPRGQSLLGVAAVADAWVVENADVFEVPEAPGSRRPNPSPPRS